MSVGTIQFGTGSLPLSDGTKETQTQRVEAWMSHGAFETFKLGTPIRYIRNTAEGSLQTLEGEVKFAAGSVTVIPNSAKDKPYPISAQKFRDLYDFNEELERQKPDGTVHSATPKKIIKTAKLADGDGTIYTGWGDLLYTAGNDYIVRHGEGDYGVVKVEIFRQTYDCSNA